MPLNYKKFVTSRNARIAYLAMALFMVVFVVCNDLLMPWYVNQRGIRCVPSVVGLQFDEAVQKLTAVGLEGRKGDVRMDRDHPAGVVIAQNPIANDTVKAGRRVYLVVSGGEIQVSVPNVRGRTVRDARFALEHEGLKLGGIEYEPSEEFPMGTVVEQHPGPGSRVKRDMYVSVVVSQGSSSEKVAVPDVTGKMLADAESILAAAGLRPGNVTYVPSLDLLPNTVIDQFPRVGEMIQNGKAVDLIVVQGGPKRKETLEY